VGLIPWPNEARQPARRTDGGPLAGVSDADQANVTCCGREPPDTNIAVSSNFIVEMVNTAMRVITRSGLSSSDTDLTGWFGIDTTNRSAGQETDARVYCDPDSGRFFASALHVDVCGGSVVGSGVRLAVSGVNDPTTWTRLAIGSNSPDHLFDQPTIGVTVGKAPNPHGWVVVGWNDFTISSGTFNGSSMVAFDKSAVIAGSGWGQAPGSWGCFPLCRPASRSPTPTPSR
jgi:hypothetical protein